MYEHYALGYWSGLALCLTKAEAVEHAVLRQLLFNFLPIVSLWRLSTPGAWPNLTPGA